jgi:hypothetical protein
MSDYLEPSSQVVPTTPIQMIPSSPSLPLLDDILIGRAWDLTTPAYASSNNGGGDMSLLAYSRHESQISTQGEPSFNKPPQEETLASSGLPPRPTTPIDASIPAWEPLFNISENTQVTIPETLQTPQILRSERCSRDTRIRVETLRALGKTYRFIADFLGITIRQVHYALKHRYTPQGHCCGRKPLLDTPRRRDLLNWIHESPSHRLTKWVDIPAILDLGIVYGEEAVTTALRTEGQGRYISRRRPPLSHRNRVKRREFAVEHIDWTPEQWEKVAWSDETSVRGGVFTQVWITWAEGEA